MSNNKIIPYVKKIAVWYKDELRELSLAYVDAKHSQFIQSAIEKSKFLRLPDGLIVPVRNIEKIDLNCKLDALEQFIASQPRVVKKYLDQKDKEMRGNVGHGIASIAHAQKIIDSGKEKNILLV